MANIKNPRAAKYRASGKTLSIVLRNTQAIDSLEKLTRVYGTKTKAIEYALNFYDNYFYELWDDHTDENLNTTKQWMGTQAEYDALGAWDNNTFYIITDSPTL